MIAAALEIRRRIVVCEHGGVVDDFAAVALGGNLHEELPRTPAEQVRRRRIEHAGNHAALAGLPPTAKESDIGVVLVDALD